MAMPWLYGAQVGLGALGLLGQSGVSAEQRRYMASAAKVSDLRSHALTDSIGRARSYDPRAEDQAAADYATATAGDQLGKNLASLNQSFGAAAGNDSLFRVRAQGAVNRIADPLKGWLANQRATETARKVDMLGSAIGQGGDLAQNYVAMAGVSQPDYSGPSQLLNAGLTGLFNKPTAPAVPIAPGAGGTAAKFNPGNYDVRYTSPLASKYRY